MELGHAGGATAPGPRSAARITPLVLREAPFGHFVQFYENDAFLLDSLAAYLGNGLLEGEAVLVVASQAHEADLDTRLRARGVDLARARGDGRYVFLDAAEGLSRFMVGGVPDRDRFFESIGGLLSRARGSGRRVRVFGEMVALLWAEGRQTAAIRLEELWNDLGRVHHFSLLCGYPMAAFSGAAFSGAAFSGSDHAAGFASICSRHGRVFAAESCAASGEPEEPGRIVASVG